MLMDRPLRSLNRFGRREILIVFAWSMLAVIVGGCAEGAAMFRDQARSAMNDNAVVAQHIGEIEGLSLNALRTSLAVNSNVFVFDVSGSRGSGRVSAEFISISADREEIRSGSLTLASGESFDLLP